MHRIYLLKNQRDEFLDKAGEWVSPENTKGLYRTEHKDEALNQKVEFSVKNFELRITIFEAELAEQGRIDLGETFTGQPRLDDLDSEELIPKELGTKEFVEDSAEKEVEQNAEKETESVKMTTESPIVESNIDDPTPQSDKAPAHLASVP